MDTVSEKTMRLEELEQELKDAKASARDAEAQKHELEDQVAQLQQQLSAQLDTQRREKDGVNEGLAKMHSQYAELIERESEQRQLTSKMQAEIADLKAQNEALRKQQVKMKPQSVDQTSKEGSKQSDGVENSLVVQVAEKEALQKFMQHYYSTAEAKCSKLLEKVTELESQKMLIREQAKESCSVIQMCTQIDSCNESVRASLLDVMATLEGLTQ
ncbi:unnamed protein product [Phytophthora fragariaefolia]|uniref:Unnamed protein product n=1 Tax=Phytophthora fragariaefolia TaxID=1490495 RepID=A0A9W6Y1E7_9STRA|nr:unnamed protein product [Phytophthora fragariaefolia]